MENKQKTLTIGMTTELMTFLNEATERMIRENEKEQEREDKIENNEAKLMIIGIVKREVSKIDEKLEKGNIKHEEWENLITDLKHLSDLVRWY